MGSGLDFTTFFRSKDKQIHVKCGCFCGDIDAFALKVQATHGDNQHAKTYMAAIELAKMLMGKYFGVAVVNVEAKP